MFLTGIQVFRGEKICASSFKCVSLRDLVTVGKNKGASSSFVSFSILQNVVFK